MGRRPDDGLDMLFSIPAYADFKPDANYKDLLYCARREQIIPVLINTPDAGFEVKAWKHDNSEAKYTHIKKIGGVEYTRSCVLESKLSGDPLEFKFNHGLARSLMKYVLYYAMLAHDDKATEAERHKAAAIIRNSPWVFKAGLGIGDHLEKVWRDWYATDDVKGNLGKILEYLSFKGVLSKYAFDDALCFTYMSICLNGRYVPVPPHNKRNLALVGRGVFPLPENGGEGDIVSDLVPVGTIMAGPIEAFKQATNPERQHSARAKRTEKTDDEEESAPATFTVETMQVTTPMQLQEVTHAQWSSEQPSLHAADNFAKVEEPKQTVDPKPVPRPVCTEYPLLEADRVLAALNALEGRSGDRKLVFESDCGCATCKETRNAVPANILSSSYEVALYHFASYTALKYLVTVRLAEAVNKAIHDASLNAQLPDIVPPVPMNKIPTRPMQEISRFKLGDGNGNDTGGHA